MKPKSTTRHFLALAASSLMAVSSSSAAGPYYWDGSDATSGFGTASGTWADPTAGTLTSGWSTSATGVATVNGNSVGTTTADSVFFGTNSVGFGLGAGTITVSGTVNAKDITFGSQSGAVTLSGGTINLAAAGQINLAGGAITINSVISGAGTSLTKAGNSQLTLTGLNTYTGATRIGSSTGGYLAVAHIANGGIASGIGASSSAASNLVLANDNFGGLNYIGSTNASTDRDFTIANGGGAYSGAIASSGTGTLTFTSTNAVSYSTTNGARNFLLTGTNTGQNTLNARLVNNGTGALTFLKTGTGTWVLANETSSYTGSTTIRGTQGVGVLSVSKMADYGTDSSIGKGTAGTAIGFDDAALVYTGSGDDTDRLVRTDRSGAIINNGTGALNFTATGNFNVTTTQTLVRGLTFGGTHGGTISGAIQNNTGTTLTVAKIGTGTWTLAGTNTYTNSTDVNAGTLRLQSGATTITQTLGALRSQSADGTLNSNKSGTGSITTNFSSYSRAAGATGNIVSTGGTNGTDNSVNITGAAGFINAGLYFGGSDFAARNATDGYVRALNYATTGGDTNTVDLDTVTASKHVKLATTSYSGAGMTLLSLNLAGSGINWTNATGNLTTPGILKSGGGSQSTISGGNVTTSSNAELVIRTDTSSDSLAITSNLTQGSGALTKSGAGTLTLSGTNTFTGQTHVNAGTLSIGANVNLGSQTTGATLNLKGGTLQATGTFGLFNGTAGTNNRAVTLLDQSTIEVTGSNTLTIVGVMSNLSSTYGTTGGFNKTGTGTLELSGTNTYTGVTNINEGTLTLGNATDTLADVSSVIVNGGILSIGGNSDTVRAVTLTSGGITGTGGTLSALSHEVRSGNVSAILGGTGALTKSTSGTVTLSGANTYTGATTVNAGTLSLTGSISSSSALVVGGGTFSYGGAAAQTVASLTVNAGSSVVTNTNSGATNLLNLNAIARNAGGTVDFSSASASNNVVTTDNSNANGILGGWATVAGADWAQSAASAADTAITAYSAYTVLDTAAGTDTVNSRITAAATLGGSRATNSLKVENPAASQSLALGANTLTLTSGGMLFTGSQAFEITGDAGATRLTDGNGSGSYELMVHQYNSGGVSMSAVVGNNGANATSMTKTGTGVLTLSGTNTYTGTTTVSAGTLLVNGNQSAATGAVSVASGATLGGTGTVGGDTTIQTGGKHGAGVAGVDNGVGTQNFTGNLTYSSASIFQWDVTNASTYDKVTGQSGKTLGGSGAIFNIISSTDYTDAFWDTNRQWTDIFSSFGTSTAWNTLFTSITGPGITWIDNKGVVGNINPGGDGGYFTLSASSLNWTAIPEPTTALAGLLLTAGLLRRRRKINFEC